MNKKELRTHMLKVASEMPENTRKECDFKICRSFLSLPEYADSKRFFIYVGSGPEISTKELISSMLRDGKEVFVPLCYGGGAMDAVQIFDIDELHCGLYGLEEPPDENPSVAPKELDIIIVPAVAFAHDGARLGRGGGYYDRYISRADEVLTIGFCRENNLLPSIYTDAHDQYVDLIITEARIINTNKKELTLRHD